MTTSVFNLPDPYHALRSELTAKFRSVKQPILDVGQESVLDQPASSNAFWAIYDATGIRPEYLIPVLSFESGLNPSVSNRAGAPYHGIGQNSEQAILNAGASSVDDYLTWPASEQLSRVVKPYFAGQVRAFGPLRSGIKVYQAEFYPVSLQKARNLDDTIVASPNSAYTANRVFDKDNKGYITPRDLGIAIGSQLSHANVQNAIQAAYQVRPEMGPPNDSIYGEDFITDDSNAGSSRKIFAVVAILAAGGMAGIYHEEVSSFVHKAVSGISKKVAT